MGQPQNDRATGLQIEPNAVGAWAVHHTNKLARIDDTGTFDRVKLAGKAGILLSAISRDSQTSFTNDQVRALAVGCRVNPTFELPLVLDLLSENHLLDRTDVGIDVLGLTTSAVLQQTGQIFTSSDPSPQELATIHLAEVCSATPRTQESVSEEIGDLFKLSGREQTELLEAAESIGFTDFEDIDKARRVYFNGNLFRRGEIAKVNAVLSTLSPDEQRKVTEAEALLRSRGCMIQSELERILGPELMRKLHAVGMYDITEVKNPKDRAPFVTRPSAFTKYGSSALSDAFDLAKIFVACLTYGIQRSHAGRGRIMWIKLLLGKLIRGAWVGSAEAIGEDYRVLETRGVIEVRPEGTRFSMRLLKREVGELALQVLVEGDASEQSLQQFPGAAITSFVSPETNRSVVRKQQRDLGVKELDDILHSLRTGKIGR